jgi:tRNA A-37 threonylcarbamoyl transferase component Bud32
MSSNQKSFIKSLGGGDGEQPTRRMSSISPELDRRHSRRDRLGSTLPIPNTRAASSTSASLTATTHFQDSDFLFKTLHSGGHIKRKASGNRADRLFVTGDADDLRVLLEQAQKLQGRLRRTKKIANDELTRNFNALINNTDDPLGEIITMFINTRTVEFKQSFFTHVVQSLQQLRKSDKRSTKLLFIISPVLQMWASIEHNDSLDSMQRIQASMGNDSSDSDLPEDESLLIHFRGMKRKKRQIQLLQKKRLTVHSGSSISPSPSHQRQPQLRGNGHAANSDPPKLARHRSVPPTKPTPPKSASNGRSPPTRSPPTLMVASIGPYVVNGEEHGGHNGGSSATTSTTNSTNTSSTSTTGNSKEQQDLSPSTSSTSYFPRTISPPPMNNLYEGKSSPARHEQPEQSPEHYISTSSSSSSSSSSAASSSSTSPSNNNMTPPSRHPMGSPSSTLSASPTNGPGIQDFEIIEPLSRGAYGRVFLAREHMSRDLVAIKVMRKSELVRKNRVNLIMEEQKIMASVATQSLPFVVGLRCSFQSRRYLFLCMEYCPGGDLLSLLSNVGCLSEDVARQYLAEMTLALGSLHALGIVHRDIKPDNVCIDVNGHVKLTDFGLSFAGAIVVQDDETKVVEDGRSHNG